MTIPIGGYDFATARAAFNLRPAAPGLGHRVDRAREFYGGHKTTLNVSQGRLNLTPQVSIEPTYQGNWVDLPEGSSTTHLAGTRVTYTVTPTMFASALRAVQHRRQTPCRPTCGCDGSIGPAASSSSSSTSSATRRPRSFPI